MQWNKTSDKLPTTEIGEQVDVIMWSPTWATWMKGVFEYWPDGGPEWGQYDPFSDNHEVMGEPYPEYWCAVELPLLEHESSVDNGNKL